MLFKIFRRYTFCPKISISLGCMNGSFGKNCMEKCGSNCISCNAVDGVCEFGCRPGWEGTFCEQSKFSNRLHSDI